ncbi:MAG: response regulator [Candidatus Omnitrophica bacterium]|nr:response regulator [Candidatus Omnitrophota bacterium]
MDVEQQVSKILIVDDENEVRSLMGLMLARRNFEVEEASGGREALTKVSKSKPDIILLDINMPDLDGFEVHRRLKSKETTKNIPVIFCTAMRIPDIINSVKSSSDDYIRKPFRSEELHQKIEEVLNRR